MSADSLRYFVCRCRVCRHVSAAVCGHESNPLLAEALGQWVLMGRTPHEVATAQETQLTCECGEATR